MLAVRAPVAALEQLLATVVAGLGSVVSTLCASLNACGSWSGLVGGAAPSSGVPMAGAGSDEVR